MGAVAALIGYVYPSGRIDGAQQRMELESKWSDGLGKKGLDQGVVLKVSCRHNDVMTDPCVLKSVLDEVEKVGKKKNRVGGKQFGYGVVVNVKVDRVEKF